MVDVMVVIFAGFAIECSAEVKASIGVPTHRSHRLKKDEDDKQKYDWKTSRTCSTVTPQLQSRGGDDVPGKHVVSRLDDLQSFLSFPSGNYRYQTITNHFSNY